jgi:hypothetical protein
MTRWSRDPKGGHAPILGPGDSEASGTVLSLRYRVDLGSRQFYIQVSQVTGAVLLAPDMYGWWVDKPVKDLIPWITQKNGRLTPLSPVYVRQTSRSPFTKPTRWYPGKR